MALRGVDLEIEPGEMVALLGPSGMGKTTVLRLMAGLIQASAGIVMVGDHDLGRLSAAERRGLRAGEISHIVQGTIPNVLLFATAIENVWFSQHAARTRGHIPPWEPDELLEMLGLQDLANERLAELPRGLQQQVAVVAGIGSGPRLLLADEPTSQLPQEATIKVVRLLQHIAAEFGTTVVIVTHDPTVAQLVSTNGDHPRWTGGRRGASGSGVRGRGQLRIHTTSARCLGYPASEHSSACNPRGTRSRTTQSRAGSVTSEGPRRREKFWNSINWAWISAATAYWRKSTSW